MTQPTDASSTNKCTCNFKRSGDPYLGPCEFCRTNLRKDTDPRSTSETPTPRTDLACLSREYIAREMDVYSHKFVLVDVCRQLERELAQKTAEMDAYKQFMTHTTGEHLQFVCDAKNLTDQLKQDLDAARTDRDVLSYEIVGLKLELTRTQQFLDDANMAIDALRKARDKALEEAAVICDESRELNIELAGDDCNSLPAAAAGEAAMIAIDIRALKSET